MGEEGNNVYTEIIINGQKEKILLKINDNSIEDNNALFVTEDTIDMTEIIKDSGINEQ